MSSRTQHSEEFELLNRNSSDSDRNLDIDQESQSTGSASFPYVSPRSRNPFRSLLSRFSPFRSRLRRPARSSRRERPTKIVRISKWRPPRPSRRCYFYFNFFFGMISLLSIFTALFCPSYTHPPAHYRALRSNVKSSAEYGRANPENQKIFVAASIYDKGGHLLKGAWGEAVLELLNILGNKNVFLSIYENGSEEQAYVAQVQFERKVQCQHSLVYDKNFSIQDVDKITLPDGSERTKRIAYLAEVRNKALLPLAKTPEVKYDRLLFLNDVVFDPVEAAQLLLSTNVDADGRASYKAACAVDFINPFKFYDTFATRDLQGYSMGVPFFPWFTNSGDGESRKDVLAGKDAVRVKSCWGGMVAFDAGPFQAEKPLRFRATADVYWDASECCLIHADLLNSGTIDGDGKSVGVYLNPFVRVAYGTWTLKWLSMTRRFERLYSIPHYIINHLVGLPWFNPRRTEQKGRIEEETVWVASNNTETGGSFVTKGREVNGDGYCGIRMLQLIKETLKDGEKNWEMMPTPPV